MSDAIELLERVRRQMKRAARIAYAERERVRREAEELLAATEAELAASRLRSTREAAWMAQDMVWSQRLELERRAQTAQVATRAAESEVSRLALERASQEARLMELLLESAAERDQLEARRAENIQLGDAFLSRWSRT